MEQARESRVGKVQTKEAWDVFMSKISPSPVVVHFTASWCMPSIAMNSFFEELALTYKDTVFLVVDVDEVKEVASEMEIKAMPTFLVMKEGAIVDKVVGANPHQIKNRVAGLII